MTERPVGATHFNVNVRYGAFNRVTATVDHFPRAPARRCNATDQVRRGREVVADPPRR